MSETTPSAAVDPTDEAAVTAAVEDALSAIRAAADLPELKTVRLAHAGEKSPWRSPTGPSADWTRPRRPPPASSWGRRADA